jgi:predicted neutral ceramidase superfamily lipid hydrolase
MLFASTHSCSGTSYIAADALVIAAIFVTAAVILISGRPADSYISVASVFGAICLALAWFSRTGSQLALVSIQTAPSRSE